MNRLSKPLLALIIFTVTWLLLWSTVLRLPIYNRWIREGGEWVRYDKFIGEVPPPNAYGLPDIASIKKFDRKYSQIRVAMIEAGWKPFRSLDAQVCDSLYRDCISKPEILLCSGTGIGTCSYLWQKDNVTIVIHAVDDGVLYLGHELYELPIYDRPDEQ